MKTGLQKLCKRFGQIEVSGVVWYWDFAKDEPRVRSEMTKQEISPIKNHEPK